jgi:hypothetical protein
MEATMTTIVELIRASLKERTVLKRRKVLDEQGKLEKEAVRLADKLAYLEAQLTRLTRPFPQADICPHCYFLEGTRNVLVSAAHPHSENFDTMTCPKCRFEDDRRTH